MLTLGTMANINAEIDAETAELLAVELGVEVDFKQAVDLAEQTLSELRRAQPTIRRSSSRVRR